jgi:hypothetical protein
VDRTCCSFTHAEWVLFGTDSKMVMSRMTWGIFSNGKMWANASKKSHHPFLGVLNLSARLFAAGVIPLLPRVIPSALLNLGVGVRPGVMPSFDSSSTLPLPLFLLAWSAFSTSRWCTSSRLLRSWMVNKLGPASSAFGSRASAASRSAASAAASDTGWPSSDGVGSASTNAYPFTRGVSAPEYPGSDSVGLGRPAIAASIALIEGLGGIASAGVCDSGANRVPA